MGRGGMEWGAEGAAGTEHLSGPEVPGKATQFQWAPHLLCGQPRHPSTPWPAPGAVLPTLGIRDPIVTKPTLQGAEGPEPGCLSQKLTDRSRPRRVRRLPGSIPSLGFIVFKGSPLINHSLIKSYRPPGSRVHTPYSKLEALAGSIYLFIYVSGS